MYWEIPQGSKINIQGLECKIPPEGHVYNIATKQLEAREIYRRSDNPDEQYWERIPLPVWYKDTMKRWDQYDKKKKEDDPDFYDDKLEKFKQQEWDRRLNGMWFMNNGKPVYITGSHYLFLQWWIIDVGFPKFRFPDLEYFYFLQYCIEDPDCMGCIEITKRRFGKCFGINTLVRMWDGSVKRVQDIKDGEYVMGNDGTSRLVHGVTSGTEEMFEVVPNKGDSFTVNKSHIIYAHLTKSKNKYVKGVGKVFDKIERVPVKFTVEEYLKFTEPFKKRLQLERVGWEYEEKQINIDPYFLGLWLGDGMSRNCEICNEDDEVIQYLKKYAAECELTYYNYGQKSKNGIPLRHSITRRNSHSVSYKGKTYDSRTALMVDLRKHPKTPLKTFGLFKNGDVQSISYVDNWLWKEMVSLGLKNNKHIPVDYKINSRDNRLKLLAGLLDSDGSLVLKNGYPKHFQISFSRRYNNLKDDAKELIQSLGFSCGEAYNHATNSTLLTIFGDIHLIPTLIARKKAPPVKRKYNSLLSGFNIRSVGEGEYYGFSVDDNHLFLLADGTVVHNTYRAGLFLVEYVTRTKMTNAGIQSKTGNDAKKLFAKAVVQPFKKLPRFFRPEYDMSLGVTPKTEMRFQQTNVRGKKAEENIDKDELGSMIDHQSADVVAYDGQKLHRYVADESAKTTEVNVYDRHEVVRYCLLDDEGRIIGKALYTTTVEKLDSDKDGVQEAFKLLWDESDQNRRQENGRTSSGLYRFFMTADRAKNFDVYGNSNVEKTIREILADRESVKNNPRALSARIRKEAITVAEAFHIDGEKSIFNPINIEKRTTQLTDKPIPLRKILFERTIEGEVRWRDIDKRDGDFYWEVSPDFDLTRKEQSIKYVDGRKAPARTSEGAISVDSYSNSQGGRKYGSKASAFYGDRKLFKVTAHLYGRPLVKDDLHKQVMLMAEFRGVKSYYEHSADDYERYFRERGMIKFLGLYPLSLIDPVTVKKAGEKGPDRFYGTPITPYSLTKQNDNGIAYFEHHSDLIDFPLILEKAPKYDPYDRTESDIIVSFLIIISVLMEPIREPKPIKAALVQSYVNSNFRG